MEGANGDKEGGGGDGARGAADVAPHIGGSMAWAAAMQTAPQQGVHSRLPRAESTSVGDFVASIHVATSPGADVAPSSSIQQEGGRKVGGSSSDGGRGMPVSLFLYHMGRRYLESALWQLNMPAGCVQVRHWGGGMVGGELECIALTKGYMLLRSLGGLGV